VKGEGEMTVRGNEQKLVDICFQIALTIKDSESLQKMSNEELAAWVREQLNACGFPTTAIGMSWGVLDR
jgi:hypothetical protein